MKNLKQKLLDRTIGNIYLEQKRAHFPRTGDAVDPLCTNIIDGGVDGKTANADSQCQSKSVTGGVFSIVEAVRTFCNEAREHCTQVRCHFDYELFDW